MSDEKKVSSDFDAATGGKKTTDAVTWGKHGGYKLYLTIKAFFFGLERPPKNKTKFSDIAESLISVLPHNQDKGILEASEKLLHLQRSLEDTYARRRLERWASRTISLYLIATFLLLILNGASMVLFPNKTPNGFMSDTIMGVVLSTTTINVIGLGVIVLKGHFDNKNKADNKKEPTKEQTENNNN